MLKIYSASWCGHCKRLKDYLRNSNIEFTDIDIDVNLEDAMDLINMRLKTIPQVFLDEVHLGGADATIKYFS